MELQPFTPAMKADLRKNIPLPANEDRLVSLVCAPGKEPEPEKARSFLVTDFSEPFIKGIAHEMGASSPRELLGDYFEFISAARPADGMPYYRVGLFNRQGNARLRSYLSVITTRHFRDMAAAASRKATLLGEHDAPAEADPDEWFAALLVKAHSLAGNLSVDDEATPLPGNDPQLLDRLQRCMTHLKPRHRDVIGWVILQNLDSVDVFDNLLPYLSLQKPPEEFTRHERQVTVARELARALAALRSLMTTPE